MTTGQDSPIASSSGSIERVAVIGTGTIGASWASYFLSRGLDVVATDPAPGAPDRLMMAIAAHWPMLEKLGLHPKASPDRICFVATPEAAVADVQFVQENSPEIEAPKAALLRRIDAAADPATVVATSTSGLLISRLQEGCVHASRMVVGHPFNPPHLIPLVEVLGGEQTDEAAIERAMAFYAAIGKKPIRLRREVKGHVANRLQAALWREAFSLVENGVASVADIDTAIAHGPGLRWALLGPFLNLALSGGAGGIRHMLAHLGPPIQSWWDDMTATRLSDGLCATVAAGVDEELGTTDLEAMVAARDTLLIDLLAAKATARELP